MDRHFIFFPSREIESTPKDIGLIHEDIVFATSDGLRLNGWLVQKTGARGTMIWFHGNGGNISHRVDQIKLFYDSLPLHLFIIDYRGYGKSEGTPSEDGTYRDAEAAVAYVRSRSEMAGGGVLYYGQSLGSAVAVELAVRRPPRGLILESPFTSIRDMARVAYPFVPVGFLIQTEYDSLSKIKMIQCPVLIMHGDRDEVVPINQGRRLFEVAHAPKAFYTISGAGHNDTYLTGGESYREQLKGFVEKVLE